MGRLPAVAASRWSGSSTRTRGAFFPGRCRAAREACSGGRPIREESSTSIASTCRDVSSGRSVRVDSRSPPTWPSRRSSAGAPQAAPAAATPAPTVAAAAAAAAASSAAATPATAPTTAAGIAGGTGAAATPAATPAATATAAAGADSESGNTLVDVATANGNFTILVRALKAAGLDDDLAGAGPYTVFAPTDAAFNALGAATVDALLKDTAKLRQVLLYHVVNGEVKSTALEDGLEAKTLQGGSIGFTLSGAAAKVQDSNIVVPDVEASNGVIHVIDKVMLPPAL